MALIRIPVLAALLVAAIPSATLAQSAPAQKAPDAAKGRVLFLQCAACHSTKRGEPNKIGPNLVGVAGAKAGTRPGYKYSQVFAKSNVVWDDARLSKFIEKPGAMMPGTKMVFGGIADPAKRADMIAYIKTLR